MSKKSIGSKTLKVGASLLALGAGVAAVNAKTKNNTEKKKIREIQKNEREEYRNTERGSMKRIVKEYIILMVIMKHLQDQRNRRALMINQLTSSAADLPLWQQPVFL